MATRQPASTRQTEPSKTLPPGKSALKVLSDAGQELATAPRAQERRHYGGVFKNGRFEKTRAATLDQLTEEQRQAILADLEEQRQRKVEELVRRQRRHAARQRREQRLEAQQVLGQARGGQPRLRGGRGPGLEKSTPGKLSFEKLAPARSWTGERQLSSPEKWREPASEVPPSLGPRPAQRVLHRHVHHHVHYHEGEGQGPNGEGAVALLPHLGSKQPPPFMGMPPPPEAPGPRRAASAAELRSTMGPLGPAYSASAGQLLPPAASWNLSGEEAETPRRQAFAWGDRAVPRAAPQWAPCP